MQIVESFGKNVFVGKQMIGYIDREGIFINRQKFADITPDGEISWYSQFAYTYNLLQSSFVQTCRGKIRPISACASTVGIAQTAFLFSVSHNLFNMLILD